MSHQPLSSERPTSPRPPRSEIGVALPRLDPTASPVQRRSGALALVIAVLGLTVLTDARKSIESVPATPAQPTEVEARFFSGQTFVSWRERAELSGESYRIYRLDEEINSGNLGSAILLYEVWEGSSAFWSDYWPCASGCAMPADQWEPRFSATMPLAPASGDLGLPADSDQGMLVWTIDQSDMIGGASDYFYAVTTVTAGGMENTTDFNSANRADSNSESIDDPRPLKILESVDGSGIVRHVYVQYMDLHTWNPTLTAPNAVHLKYGQNLTEPSIANAIQYAFSYVVLEPPPPHGGPLPVVLKLHHYLRDTYSPDKFLDAASNFQLEENYDYPAIEIRPIDVGSTWWFGFAEKGFDYRSYADKCAAIDDMALLAPAIENFTEARTLRMLYDLQRDTDYWSGKVDSERAYVIGHSMGGAGSLAMALRYPEVFAATYSTAPVTDFRRIVDPLAACVTAIVGSVDCPQGFQYDIAYDVALKWGPPGLGGNPFQHVYPAECAFDNPPAHTQPVVITGPSDWADHLDKYDGTPVYDWQDHISNLDDPPADVVAPINIRHSSTDAVVNWNFQGQPIYEKLNDANIVWSGLVDDFLDHLKPWWSLGISPSYADLPGLGPFYGLSAVLSETVPGLRLLTVGTSWLLPPPSVGIHVYNADFPGGLGSGAAVEWSSSWNPWDGAPVDLAEDWRITLRTVDGSRQRVDITPRRLQNFVIKPGKIYTWESARLDGVRVDCGCIIADANGIITIKSVALSGSGRRIRLRPGIVETCGDCLIDSVRFRAPLSIR